PEGGGDRRARAGHPGRQGGVLPVPGRRPEGRAAPGRRAHRRPGDAVPHRRVGPAGHRDRRRPGPETGQIPPPQPRPQANGRHRPRRADHRGAAGRRPLCGHRGRHRAGWPLPGPAPGRQARGRLGALEDGQGEAMSVPDDPTGVFEAHYRELDPRAAELYLGLGLHPTPDFDRWCGHAILHGHPRDEADAALRTLLARGLVQQGRPGRYAMHDLAHEHAARTAQRELPPARRRRISRRIADHYLYAAVAADRRLSQRWRVGPLYQAPAPYRLPDFAETDPAEWLGDSLDAIAACMEDAAGIRDPHPGYCWQMGEATNAYFTAHGRTDVGPSLRALAEQEAGRCEEHDARARIRAQQGGMMLGRGRLDEADARFRLSLAAAERGTDPRGRGAALEWLGITRRKKGDGAAAIGFLDRSLPFLDATRARPFALHHMHKGDAYRVMGEDEAALAQYATALHFFAEHARTDRRDEANEGKVRLRRASLLPPGDRAEAVALITEALGLFRAAGRPYQQAKALEALGDADAGERADRSPWDEALKLFEEYRYPEDAARVRAKIAGGSSG